MTTEMQRQAPSEGSALRHLYSSNDPQHSTQGGRGASDTYGNIHLKGRTVSQAHMRMLTQFLLRVKKHKIFFTDAKIREHVFSSAFLDGSRVAGPPNPEVVGGGWGQ